MNTTNSPYGLCPKCSTPMTCDPVEPWEGPSVGCPSCGHKQEEAAQPQVPPRPPHNNDASYQHPALPRYGLQWNGPGQPVSVPMADGYWTPFHLALAEVERLTAELDRLRAARP